MQTERAAELCALAREIWTEHYTPIIGPEQTEYMLGKFQSPAALASAMEDGYRYYFIYEAGVPAGYIGFRAEGGEMFLSKLYIKKEFRGRGLARDTVNRLSALCRMEGLGGIWLTVNRHNSGSIAVYRALGFAPLREQVSDIGGGYVMDDLVLKLTVQI